MTLASRLLEACKTFDAALGLRLARRAARAGPARPAPADPRDVLVVRLWGLGNLALIAPTLRAHGHRRLRLLTLARHADFVREHLPRVEPLLLSAPPSPRLPAELLRLRAELRRDPPEVVVDLEQFLRLPLAFVRAVSGAPTVGLDVPSQGRAPLLDVAVPHDPTRHAARTFGAVLAAAGLPAGPDPAPLRPRRRALERIGARLGPRHGPLVVLHPGSGDHFPGRRWPIGRFSALARALAADGCQLVATGVAAERALVRRLVARGGAPVRDLAGRLDVPELVALLARADLLVTNDTGPLHLADAVGTPVLGLYGPNTPLRYGPRGPRSLALYADLPCSPCLDDRTMKHSACRHHACMEALDTDAVLAAARRLLDPARRPVDRPAREPHAPRR